MYRARSALPPLAPHQHYHHAYSRSLNAMAASPPSHQQNQHSQQIMSLPQSIANSPAAHSQIYLSAAIGAELPPVAHQRGAKSCDFDMLGASANQIAQQPVGIPSDSGTFCQQQAEYFDAQQLMLDELVKVVLDH